MLGESWLRLAEVQHFLHPFCFFASSSSATSIGKLLNFSCIHLANGKYCIGDFLHRAASSTSRPADAASFPNCQLSVCASDSGPSFIYRN